MGTESIYNFLRINDRISTGGQPDADQLRSAAAEGFEAVINLATYHPGHSLEDEAALVRSLGMDYYPIPVEWSQPLESDFSAFEQLMSQLSGRKVLIHCAANFRVSAFYSLFALKHLSWTREQAAEFRIPIWQGSSVPVWEAFIQAMESKLSSETPAPGAS